MKPPEHRHRPRSNNGLSSLLQPLLGHVPDGTRLTVARVGDDATPRIHVRRLDSGFAESLFDQPAGKAFSKAEQMILRL